MPAFFSAMVMARLRPSWLGVDKLNPSEEKWLIPEAYFQIGRCYMRLGDRKKAEEYFDKANDVDYDYDFKDSMDGKIKNELSKK